MWVPGSQKEPKQLHGRKERIPSPDAWSGVLDHIHCPQKVSYVRGVVHGTLSREFTWGCSHLGKEARLQDESWVSNTKASWEKSPVRWQPGGRECK